MQIRQIPDVPPGVIPFLLGNLRIHPGIEGVPIVKGHRLDGLPIGNEPQGQLPQRLGKLLQGLHFFIAHRLGYPLVADPVDACQSVGDKVVPGEHTGVLTGHRTQILLGLQDIHHGVAPGDLAGLPLQILLGAAAHNAANVAAAGQGAFGKAVADAARRQTGDAADVVAVLTGDPSVAPAVQNQSQVHSAAHAAHIVALAGDGACVFTGVDNGRQLIPAALAELAGGSVIFRVGDGLQAHDSGDAAYIQVGLHQSGVDTLADKSGGDTVHIQIQPGKIQHRLLLGILGCQAEGSGNGGNLTGNGADVPSDGVRAAADDTAQGIRCADHSLNGPLKRIQSILIQFPVSCGENQIPQCPLGLTLAVGDYADAVFHIPAHVGPMGTGAAHHAAQGLKLLAEGLQIVRGQNGVHMGLHLPGDTACILPALNGAGVGAAVHHTAGAAHNAAQVVADVGIADIAAVFAVPDGAPGVTGNAAGVGGCIVGIQIRCLGQIQVKVQGNVLDI